MRNQKDYLVVLIHNRKKPIEKLNTYLILEEKYFKRLKHWFVPKFLDTLILPKKGKIWPFPIIELLRAINWQANHIWNELHSKIWIESNLGLILNISDYFSRNSKSLLSWLVSSD